jgi:hypothetical protein
MWRPWIEIAFLGALCVLALIQVRKLWRHETTYWDRSAPSWWVGGEASFRGYVRGLPLGVAGTSILAAKAVPATLAVDVSGSPTENMGVAIPVFFGASLFLVTTLLWLGVVLLNRPKLAVPPHLRGEAGVLSPTARAPRR